MLSRVNCVHIHKQHNLWKETKKKEPIHEGGGVAPSLLSDGSKLGSD